LRSNFNQEVLIAFCASLKLHPFFELRILALNFASVFGSTCTCEQTYACIKRNKSKFRSRTTDVHFYDEMIICISK